MPIPKPKTGEAQKDFISRCMSDDIMKRDYPKDKLDQRLAICFTSWRAKGKKEEEIDNDKVVIIPIDIKTEEDAETRIITISERLGIKALYTFNRKKIIEYYFNRNKDWDEEKAVEWYTEHSTIEVQSEEQAKKFFKMDEEKHIVYGVFLVPWEVDLQGDIMTAEEVKNAVHSFSKSFQDIGEMHTRITGMGTMLEIYVAPCNFEMNGVKVIEGSGILVTEPTQDIWEKIKTKELTGYSIEYVGEREPIEG